MASGTVKWFNATKGFGFIQPDNGGKDVFVHISAVERAGLQGLNEGQKISYEVQSERGKDAAVNLKVRSSVRYRQVHARPIPQPPHRCCDDCRPFRAAPFY